MGSQMLLGIPKRFTRFQREQQSFCAANAGLLKQSWIWCTDLPPFKAQAKPDWFWFLIQSQI
jgi:hypothetical protein